MNEQQLIEFIHSLLPNSSFYIHCGAYYGIHNQRKKISTLAAKIVPIVYL